MSYSTIDIANRALSKLGVNLVSNTVTALSSENTESARTMNAMFDKVRDRLLRSHPWNFAMRRTSLAPEDATPAWGYDYQYLLPSDYLRMMEISASADGQLPVNYRIENGRLLTNTGPVIYILYVARVADTSQFDELFVEALASRLAYEAAERLSGISSVKEQARQDFEDTMAEARRADGRDDGPEPFYEDEWILARQ